MIYILVNLFGTFNTSTSNAKNTKLLTKFNDVAVVHLV